MESLILDDDLKNEFGTDWELELFDVSSEIFNLLNYLYQIILEVG